jgi:hypothetical protein
MTDKDASIIAARNQLEVREEEAARFFRRAAEALERGEEEDMAEWVEYRRAGDLIWQSANDAFTRTMDRIGA